MRSDIKFDITFGDLDNAEFAAFLRTPEFSTWLVLMSRVWRSAKPHSAGLHNWYARGLLTAAVKSEYIAQKLSTSERSIRADIAKLAETRRIGVVRTDSGNIYVMGEYSQDEGGAYTMMWYGIEPEWQRNMAPTGRDIPPEPEKVSQLPKSFDSLFGSVPPKTPNGSKVLDLSRAEDELVFLVGGEVAGVEREAKEAGWGKYRQEIFNCCVWFCEAAIKTPPRGKTIQAHWITAFEEHLLEHGDSLREKYKLAAKSLKDIGYDIHGPQSLTKTLFNLQVDKKSAPVNVVITPIGAATK